MQTNPGTKGITPGTLAFARRKVNDDLLWWPSLLYPSWSMATRSQLMILDKRDASINAISIQGVTKKISIDHLKKNMVPMKAAVNYSPDPKNKKKTIKKIVVHFLGLDLINTPQWAAVTRDELMPYYINSEKLLKMYKGKIAASDWQDLLTAMEEAALAVESIDLEPKRILKSIKEKSGEIEQTPEFFNDWSSKRDSQRLSQGTERFSDTQLTQFSMIKDRENEKDNVHEECTKNQLVTGDEAKNPEKVKDVRFAPVRDGEEHIPKFEGFHNESTPVCGAAIQDIETSGDFLLSQA